MRLRHRILNWFVIFGLLIGVLAPVIALASPPTVASAEEAAIVDVDLDGIDDALDNCPEVSNPLQENSDGVGPGDACEPLQSDPPLEETVVAETFVSDIDGDGFADDLDNCPDVYNSGQEDWDDNGVGDACDIPATGSINIATYNRTPGEVEDLIGGGCFQLVDSAGTSLEACDGVDDAYVDGVVQFFDVPSGTYTVYHLSGPEGYLPLASTLTSVDLGAGVTVDLVAGVARPDMDGDGYADLYDNCPDVYNPDQLNTNETPEGDACDPVADPVLEPTHTPPPTEMPAGDQDFDGLSNEEEAALGTDPTLPDTDGDGLGDRDEVYSFGTNPLQPDENPDSDADGLSDYMESLYQTDPNNPDSDSDGLSDGDEVSLGSDPLNASSPGDAAPPPTTVPFSDQDNDGLSDEEEAMLGTDRALPDTDGDGLGDWDEVYSFGTNPLQPDENPDSDADGLSDYTESRYGTDPNNPDSDSDGLSDGDEVSLGSDPLNASSPGDVAPVETPPGESGPQDGTGNTQPGSNVEVIGLADGQVTVTFGEIAIAGDTTAVYSGAPDPETMPVGYTSAGALVYEISTTADSNAGATVCIAYDPATFANPSTVQLFHGTSDGWELITTTNDYADAAGLVCGLTPTLSPFMVAEETPAPPSISSLQVSTQDWYGEPVPNVQLLLQEYSCDTTDAITATTDENGIALLEGLSPVPHCIMDADGIYLTHAYLQPDQPNEVLVTVGVQPEWGHIVLVLQGEDGVPLTPEQLTSNACVHAYSEEGGANGCDNADGVIDGRIAFSGMPLTVWTLADDYRAPYGYQAMPGQMPTEISGFVPGETKTIGVRHTTFASPSASLIVYVVDAQGNPLPGACFEVATVENASGCDKGDGNNDGRVFIYGPFAPGEYTLISSVDYNGGGLPALSSQPFTVPENTTIATTIVTMQPSLVVNAADSEGNPVTSCYWVEGAAFQGELCDGRDGVDGRATVYGLPDGDYIVSHPYVPYGYATTFTTATVSVVSGASAQVDVPFTTRTDAALRITVTDENGIGLANACPDVFEVQDGTFAAGCTDASGVATFYDVSGEVTVALFNPLYGYAPIDPVTINVEETSTLALISNSLPKSVVVQTVDSSGASVADACVTIWASETWYDQCDRWDTSPGNGQVVFYGVTPGIYQIQVTNSSGAFELYTGEINVQESGPLEVEVTLVPAVEVAALARITSVDASGNPLAGACYTLLFPGRGVWYQCDEADGARDGVTTFGSRWETYYNGEYTLIQSRAPEGAPEADNQTFTVGTERPVAVTVTHEVWAMETGTGPVTVTPSGNTGVALTFDNVTVAGSTTVQPVTVEEVPELSPEFAIDGAVFFDIHTTAVFDGVVAVCLPYDPANFERPEDLALLHYENNAWTDVTVSNDPVSGIICGSVSSFSPFALAMTASVPNSAPVVGSVTRLPTGQVASGTAVNVSASFTDVDTDDSHTATIDWGDGTVETVAVTESAGAGTVSGTHTYTAAGVYHITVTVTDNEGAAGTKGIAATIDVPESKPVKPPKPPKSGSKSLRN